MVFFLTSKASPRWFPVFSGDSASSQASQPRGPWGIVVGRRLQWLSRRFFFCFGFSDFVGMFQERGLIYIIPASAFRDFFFWSCVFFVENWRFYCKFKFSPQKKGGGFKPSAPHISQIDRQMRGQQWDWVCVVVSSPGKVWTSPWSSPSEAPREIEKKTVGFSGFRFPCLLR